MSVAPRFAVHLIARMRFCLVAVSIFLLAACGPRPVVLDGIEVPAGELSRPKTGSHSRYWTRSQKYMIATDAPEASAAGVEMYEAGGNIVDAAVAVSFAISVVRPQSTGLGGGGFLVLHLADSERTESFDFRERAPLSAHRDMYLDEDGTVSKEDQASLFGPRAVGVPGTVAGLVEIHAKYGKLPLAKTIEPALRLARDGFPVYPDLKRSIMLARTDFDDEMARVFLPGGRLPDVGDVLVQSDLAKTLRIVAENGRAPLYSADGEIAKALAGYMQANGGLITTKDLTQYRVLAGPPLRTKYRDRFEVAIMPPPSSGVFILEMLHMLETKDLRALYESDRVQYEHFLAEVFRRGYADRAAYGGDARFFDVPAAQLTSRRYARERIANFSPEKVTENAAVAPAVLAPALPDESNETTHFSIMDADGNAVASTQSVNYGFGARVMLPGWGIVLNDTMDDFSKSPGVPNAYGLIGGEANAIAPGKTPLSSMSPTIVFDEDGRALMAVGAPGGSRIITGILQTMLHDLDLGLHPYVSVARGRIHHQFLPNKLSIADSPRGRSRAGALKKLGHDTVTARWQAKVFFVRRDEQGFVGVSDPRGDGQPMGEPPGN